LSRQGESLREAIATERKLLAPVLDNADLVIDTSGLGVHDLRDLVFRRVDQHSPGQLSILCQSFGYKHGLPGDADFVFDARSLPNPYWDSALRPLTGLDEPVKRFLGGQAAVAAYIDDVYRFMAPRIPEFFASARRYLTVAVGCTGGQHRSVYVAERLAERFAREHGEVRVRHASLTEGQGGHAVRAVRSTAVPAPQGG
jgi:UPF0042 nucleotide-binding protein